MSPRQPLQLQLSIAGDLAPAIWPPLCDLLERHLPGMVPRVFGDTDRPRTPYRRDHPEEVEWAWHPALIWKGQMTGTTGTIWPSTARGRHAEITMDMRASDRTAQEAVAFLKAAGAQFGADFGFVHRVREEDLEVGRSNTSIMAVDRAGTRWNLFVAGLLLLKFLPDLYWATLLGAPYVEMFGRERVLSAPAESVEEVAPGVVCLRLTASLSDRDRDPAAFEETRLRVKEHLGPDAFFDLNPRRFPRYRTPTFSAQEPDVGEASGSPGEPGGTVDTTEISRWAEACVQAAGGAGFTLDYSEASVALLDRMIDELWGPVGPSPENVEAMASAIGAYIGEVIRSSLGWEWSWNQEFAVLGLTGPRGDWVFPMEKARKRLVNGAEDGLDFYFRAVKSAM